MNDNSNNNIITPNINSFLNYLDKNTTDQPKDESTKKKKRRHHHHRHKKSKSKEKEAKKNKLKKSGFNNEQFIINGNYNLIKLLGYGTFGEIILAFDNNSRQLRAIKFEIMTAKNAQLKHEYTIYEQLNIIEERKNQSKKDKEIYKGTIDAESITKITMNYVDKANNKAIGIPKVYYFDKIENRFSYMVMDFLGPSLGDLFQLMQKKFSLQTICMCGMQMMCRLEYIHEKGFIHRDIKPENFVTGINDDSNTIYIIDFGLARRFKDKKTGSHTPYRENRQMIGTVRYASINTQIGIEQSRRDDVEAVGYVLVYLALGRLPWQRAGKEKGKGHLAKVLEKKLITPPEILCKKLPKQFSFIFQYIRKLKFEERPDYNMMKCLLADLLLSKMNLTKTTTFSFDWFKDPNNLELSESIENMKQNESSNKTEENKDVENENENDNDNENAIDANYDKLPDNHPKIEDENEDIKNNNIDSNVKEKHNMSSEEIDSEEDYDEDEEDLEKKKQKQKEKEKLNQKNTENFVKFENFKEDDDVEQQSGEEKKGENENENKTEIKTENKAEDNKAENKAENATPQGEQEPLKKDKSSSESYGLIKSDSGNKK